MPSHGPKILTCSTEAASDVEIAVQIKKLVRNIPVTVAAMDRVAPDAIRLVLKADSGKPIEFIPGQFVRHSSGKQGTPQLFDRLRYAG